MPTGPAPATRRRRPQPRAVRGRPRARRTVPAARRSRGSDGGGRSARPRLRRARQALGANEGHEEASGGPQACSRARRSGASRRVCMSDLRLPDRPAAPLPSSHSERRAHVRRGSSVGTRSRSLTTLYREYSFCRKPLEGNLFLGEFPTHRRTTHLRCFFHFHLKIAKITFVGMFIPCKYKSLDIDHAHSETSLRCHYCPSVTPGVASFLVSEFYHVHFELPPSHFLLFQ